MSDRSTVIRSADGVSLSFERARLLVEEGPDAGEELLLVDQPVILGRGDGADLPLRDPEVSRAHAMIQPAGEGWKLRDLGSKGGTFLDGTRVEVAPLEPGSRVRIGGTELVLRTGRVEVRTTRPEGTSFEGLLGEDPRMRELFGVIESAADLELPVMVLGESGAGKEGIARAVHARSALADGPYVVVDCTLLERDHLRSELFGHVKGAFTGADADRKGAFERADGGTLFLDEVAELPVELQPALLRVLEEGEVRPLGSDDPRRVRVRVVSATNRDLRAMIAAGEFRQDLFYRLSALEVAVPPLRERGEDVVRIAEHFLPAGAELTDGARDALRGYAWPGNVRELRNVIQRAAGMARGKPIGARELRLPDADRSASRGGAAPAPARPAPATPAAAGAAGKLADYEEQAILDALEACGGNRRQAAKRLGIARSTLYRKLKELGID